MINKGQFQKGHKPWNKGKYGYSTKRKGQKGHPNAGFQRGHKNYNLGGYKWSKESREKMVGNKQGFKKGKENPRYTGFLNKKYKIKQLEWLAIRQLILERDLFKCQFCGKNHHETLLDVHHKIPFKISKDNSKENLITLCRSCHMKIEKATIKEIELNSGRINT